MTSPKPLSRSVWATKSMGSYVSRCERLVPEPGVGDVLCGHLTPWCDEMLEAHIWMTSHQRRHKS